VPALIVDCGVNVAGMSVVGWCCDRDRLVEKALAGCLWIVGRMLVIASDFPIVTNLASIRVKW
jgi:hypothetical protein